MPCIPCMTVPIIFGSSLLTFLNKNKKIIISSIIILIISLYLYNKYKNCKECKQT